jgi:hypothetical protein
MKLKISILSIVALLCLGTTSAMADLFDFTISNPTVQYVNASTTLTVAANPTVGGTGDVVGQSAPALNQAAHLLWDIAVPDAGSFSLTMSLSNIDSTANTADGAGLFAFTDSTGDTITGGLTGNWYKTQAGQNHFDGVLSSVMWNDTSGDGQFDGGPTSNVLYPNNYVNMGFTAPLPWQGSIVQLTTGAVGWFDHDFSDSTGSIDAIVVPVPGAILLGLLGLGVAGIKMRKFA